MSATTVETEFASNVFERLSQDLGMILDREITVSDVRQSMADSRPVGEGQVHISFRLVTTVDDDEREGCLLVPLAEAITLAGYLMMVEDEVVTENRDSTDLDDATKEAILEVGNFVAGAVDAVVRSGPNSGAGVRAGGCQGVRSDVRPALDYEDGEALIVGRAKLAIHTFPAFEAILMLPPV